MGSREHVHGTTLSTAAACGLAKELSHDRTCRDALGQRMDVITVRANNTISLVQKLDEASGDSLLAIVKVDKTKHLATVVHLCAHVLKYTAKNHVFIQLQCLFPCNSLEKMTDPELRHSTVFRNSNKLAVPESQI